MGAWTRSGLGESGYVGKEALTGLDERVRRARPVAAGHDRRQERLPALGYRFIGQGDHICGAGVAEDLLAAGCCDLG